MSTEYYIVKPEEKKTFYLGKRINDLDGIPIFSKVGEAKYPSWEYWEDVVFDIQENSRYFLEGCSDTTVGQVWDFCYQLYEFCNGPVYLDNDCSDNFSVWKDWETIDVFEEIFGEPTTELEKWADLINLIPFEDWVVKEEDGIRVIYELETVANYLQKIKKEKEEKLLQVKEEE